MFAIYKREMRAYFTTPIGYVFLAVFLAASGFIFSLTTLQAASSDITQYYMIMLFVYIIVLPLLTMKSFSEERKMRTEQLLMTAPISLPGMVVGKFLAALTMFAGSSLITCLYFYTLYKYGEDINAAMLFGNVFGVLLIGSAFIAIGIFVSSLTENQLSAAILTIGIIALLMVISFANSLIDSYFIRSILSWISIFSRYQAFSYGIFDFSALLYYISICVVFLFLTVRIYERRRWN